MALEEFKHGHPPLYHRIAVSLRGRILEDMYAQLLSVSTLASGVVGLFIVQKGTKRSQYRAEGKRSSQTIPDTTSTTNGSLPF